jgi:hypothetical protein
VPNIGLSNEDITEWVVANIKRFKAGTDTGNGFDISTYQSPVYVVDSNGPDYGYRVNKDSILQAYDLNSII